MNRYSSAFFLDAKVVNERYTAYVLIEDIIFKIDAIFFFSFTQ